jgi:hypothetical protein
MILATAVVPGGPGAVEQARGRGNLHIHDGGGKYEITKTSGGGDLLPELRRGTVRGSGCKRREGKEKGR